MSRAEQDTSEDQKDNTKEQEGEEQEEKSIALSEKERAKADTISRPNVLVIHEVIREEGENELQRSVLGLSCSALASGLAMGFSLVALGLLRAHLPDAPWRPLVVNLGYTVGFVIVIGGRQQLFTENTLTPVLPLLNKPSWKTFGLLLRLWAVVLTANLVGALLFAWIAGSTGMFEPKVRDAFAAVGHEAIMGGPGLHLLRGIFAGWLIALVAWLLPGVEGARLGIIIILTYLVGLAGLAHIIAGSVETLYLVTTGAASWGDYFGQFMLPTLLGNIIGGVTIVAALNYGQVAPEKEAAGG